MAEEALVAFYRAQGIVRAIRSPASFGRETKELEQQYPDEARDHPGTIHYFLPLLRMKKYDSKLEELEKSALLARVYFGRAADQPYRRINDSLHQIAVAAHMLLGKSDPSGELRDKIKKWEDAIWSVEDPTLPDSQKTDQIELAVRKAVQEAESMFRPVVNLEGSLKRWIHRRFHFRRKSASS